MSQKSQSSERSFLLGFPMGKLKMRSPGSGGSKKTTITPQRLEALEMETLLEYQEEDQERRRRHGTTPPFLPLFGSYASSSSSSSNSSLGRLNSPSKYVDASDCFVSMRRTRNTVHAACHAAHATLSPTARRVARVSKRVGKTLFGLLLLIAMAMLMNVTVTSDLLRKSMNDTSSRKSTKNHSTLTDDASSLQGEHSVISPSATPIQHASLTLKPTIEEEEAPETDQRIPNNHNNAAIYSGINFTDSIWNSKSSGKSARKYQPPDYSSDVPVTAVSQAFVDRWCDMRGVSHWYPVGNNAWQRRTPAVVLPGVKYGGTSALAAYLLQHPDLVAPITPTPPGRPVRPGNSRSNATTTMTAAMADTKFFLTANFAPRHVFLKNEKTHVLAARQRMYARDYPVHSLKQHDNLISIDATPGYLFQSSLLPRRMLCVIPWVRLVILLRNPVDRVYDHYLAATQKGLKQTFEEWIDKDFDLMYSVGLLLDNKSNVTAASAATATTSSKRQQAPANSKQNNNNNNNNGKDENQPLTPQEAEDLAWFDYQTSTLEGAIGRSLYEIQLRQWFQAIRTIDRKPSETVLIVRAEQFVAQPVTEYQRILQFLGLSTTKASMPTQWRPPLIPQQAAVKRTGMKASTRQRLEKFFEPYNQRLLRLLETYQVPFGS